MESTNSFSQKINKYWSPCSAVHMEHSKAEMLDIRFQAVSCLLRVNPLKTWASSLLYILSIKTQANISWLCVLNKHIVFCVTDCFYEKENVNK
jgi:hypothetical protein